MTDSVKTDIAIIGGGMAGASAGYFLADDAQVVLLEREAQPGYHTTGRSAALLFEGYGNAVIRAITKGGRSFFESPPDGFSDTPVLSPRGGLMVATDEQLGLLDEGLAEAQATGVPCELIDGDALSDVAPFLRRDVIVRGLYEPGAMDMDVHAILQGFLRGLRAKGGRVQTESEVLKLSRSNGVWRIETRSGTVEAKIVVNAAGAWADDVAKMAGAQTVGLVPKRRTAFTFDPAPGLDITHWPLTAGADESWYVKPDAGRIFGSPADQTPSAPCDAQPEELDLAIAADRIMTHTTLEIRRFASTWAGLRSFVADKSPVLGFDPLVEGFFWLAGQGGYGIQTAPGMGRLTASLIKGSGIPSDIKIKDTDLAPDRPGLM
jgi:D-arginine dehydrogenase